MSNNKQDHIVDTNKMISSVEWLESIIQHCQRFGTNVEQKDIEQAKAMHKEEMMNFMKVAFTDGLSIGDGHYKSAYQDYEQYYNETFGGNK